MPTIPVTPDAQRRVLHVGMKGSDVRAAGRLVARALKRNSIVSTNAQNGVYGDGLLKDVLRFQSLVGLTPDGQVGPLTWNQLDPYMHAYERLLLKLPTPKPATNGVKLAHQFRVALALRLDRYSQARPGPTGFAYPWKRSADCSDSFLLFRSIVLGQPYSGYGNTGTIWSTYTPIAPGNVQVGDAALYGHNGTTTHVQCVTDVTYRANPDSIGFGSAPGNRYSVHTRPDFMGYRRTV
jgi:peptidoglycan hydrolase-like protein with peptidoglycan-binding domain